MRRIQLLCFCSGIFLSAAELSAQTEKNQVYTGITFNRGQYIEYGTQPSLSVGLGRHGMMGIHGSYFRGKSSPMYGTVNYAIQFGGGINYTYYKFFKKSHKLGWFINTGFTYHRFNVYQIKNDEKFLNYKYGQTDIYTKPGIFFKPPSKVILFINFGGIGLQSSRGNNDLDISLGSQANVGVLINIGTLRKKRKE